MSLKYFREEDCDRAGNQYISFSCSPSTSGGNECVGQGSGGEFTDCKKCLANCNNSPENPDKPVKPGNNDDPVTNKKINDVKTDKMQTIGMIFGIALFLAMIVLAFYFVNKNTK